MPARRQTGVHIRRGTRGAHLTRSSLVVDNGSVQIRRFQVPSARTAAWWDVCDGGVGEETRHLAVQAPDFARVLVFVNVAIEDFLAHFEVDLACDPGVGARLVGGADAFDVEGIGDVLETRFRAEPFENGVCFGGERLVVVYGLVATREFEEEFNVKEFREEDGEEVVEFGFVVGEGFAEHEFHEVSEVIARVERDPADIGEEDEAGGHEQGAELVGVDALLGVLFKVYTGFLEHGC